VQASGGSVPAHTAAAAISAAGGLGTACCDAVAAAAEHGFGGVCWPADGPCAPAAGQAGSASSSQLQSAASANSEETHVSSQHMTATHRSADACAAAAVDALHVHPAPVEFDCRQCCQPRGQAKSEHIGFGAPGSLPVGDGAPCMRGAAPSLQAGRVADQQRSTRSSDGWHLRAEPHVRLTCGEWPSPHGLHRRARAPPVLNVPAWCILCRLRAHK